MKKNEEKHFTLRIDKDLFKKFRYAVTYDDHSMNSVMVSLVNRCVVDFEKKHGEITFDSKK